MKNRKVNFVLALLLVVCSVGILLSMGKKGDKRYEKIEYVIGVSQANMLEAWRIALTDEIQEEAEKWKEIRLVMTDATSNTQKQKKDVERLLDLGIDLLVISPCDVEEMTSVIREVYQKKIPVIVMDRGVDGFDYTLFIGPDNELIGKQAGEGVVRLLEDKKGNILEICGSQYSITSQDRSKGFNDIISKYNDINKKQCRVESDSKDETEDLLLAMGEQLEDIDVIFAHNDYMAFGAAKAVQKLGYDIKIVGIDGFAGENEGIDLIKKGSIAETITCPTGGKEAVQYALDILNRVSGVPKQIILRSHSVTADNVNVYINNMTEERQRMTEGIIDVGYAQVGTESAWRLANTRSIKEAAKSEGINLIFDDANQRKANQIQAIRKFIELDVDIIVLSPVIDRGWDEILLEAKEAKIPVILSDRTVDVEDNSLITTYIGADFLEEGRRAMRWIVANMDSSQKTVNIMELQGSAGAAPTVERKRGFEEILYENKGYKLIHSFRGDYTYESGKQIIEEYLQNNTWDIDAIFAHNDDMALGAIQALKDSGMKPGKDVKIISVDGTKEAFQALSKGTLNCVVECSPLLGPQLMKAIQDFVDGKELPLRIITEEKVYVQEDANKLMRNREY